MTHPAVRQGEQDLERVRGLVLDARGQFDNTSADIIAKLETFRHGLVAAIGDISPSEARDALDREAARLFQEWRAKC